MPFSLSRRSVARTSLVFFIGCGMLVLALMPYQPARAQEDNAGEVPHGTIAGVIVDAETGDALTGANAAIVGTTTGTQADVEGRFEIGPLEPGTYDVRLSYIGYRPQRIDGVEVEAGAVTRLDVRLQPETQGLGEVVVQAEAARDSEAGLLRRRQKAAAVSNAISAEAMSRSGSSTAADALQKVTGASVVDGAYLHVRGLGGRYVNTQLNGAALPSSDPDRNAVPLDLFPSGLLDHVTTTKSFTPDQDGSFTGGSVDIGTKAFPERMAFQVSTSASMTTALEPGAAMLQAPKGVAGVPEAVAAELPSVFQARTNEQLAATLDEASKAFTAGMAPIRATVPVNQSYGLSFGNRYQLGNRPLGLVASLTYDQSASGYDGGQTGQHKLVGDVSSVDGLVTELDLDDTSGTQETLLGGLASLSFQPHPAHELSLSAIYNRSDTQKARYQVGHLPRDLNETDIYETRVLHHTQRALGSLQGQGEHVVAEDSRLTWNASVSRSKQNEPDLRYFTNHIESRADDRPIYKIAPALYSVPTRYFRDMTETTQTGALALSLPALGGRVKLGGSARRNRRAFREHKYEYRQDAVTYKGDPEAFFDAQVGLMEVDESGRYRFGNYVANVTEPGQSYDGRRDVTAGYAMLDVPVPGLARLRVIGGARLEHTDQVVENRAATPTRGRIQKTDWLPSANLVYALASDMNLRLAYGRTLARPSLREFAPFCSFEFVGDVTYCGNPELTRTTTHNLDLRWEWFPRAGELLAVSAFYKDFTDPIERVYFTRGVNEIRYQNVDHAVVAGVEFEARRRLSMLPGPMQHLQIGGNLTLSHSAVGIAAGELELIRQTNPRASGERALQGQSPYVVNADLSYEHPGHGISAGLYYNVFGPRLHAVTKGGTPDLMERPRHMLDATLSQQLPFGLRVKASAKNLLGADYNVVQHFKEETYVSQQHVLGRSFSLGLSYRL